MTASSSPGLFAVVTTIQPPTPAMRELHRRLVAVNARMVVAGDRKGPATFDLPGCDFLSLADQQASGFSLAGPLPIGHYARKNIGYLRAIQAGAACIYETDDDNEPLPSWIARQAEISGHREITGPSSRWVNVYRHFCSDRSIWPRGFPLERLVEPVPAVISAKQVRRAPIQQGLANLAPDVDAVWRLTQDRPFGFDDQPSVWLGPGQWCPFNTQTTWWWPEAYPLLYVPSHCPFRMCDIWKSFVAQRCLWAMGLGVAFHAPEVRQDRNPHDFLKDFKDEVPGYLQNARIAQILDGLSLDSSVGAVHENLRACYTALVAAGIFPRDELNLLELWIADVRALA
jgi:hypothetical protein